MSNVTRRNAIRTGALGSISAALLGATATTANAEPAHQLATVVNGADIASVCRTLAERQRAARERASVARRALTDTMTPEQISLYIQAANADNEAIVNEMDWRVAEIARHLPGVAPAVMLVGTHFDATTYIASSPCCTVETGFEV